MELHIYNKKFVRVGLIDTFISLIWTKRYRECGDFEIKIPVTTEEEFPDWIQCDYYASLNEDVEDGYYMTIDTIEMNMDEEEGATVTISGKSLDNLLNRRIVWEQTAYSQKKTSYIIEDLLNRSIINPTLALRRIDNFLFIPPESDEDFSTIDAEYTGDNLLTVIQGLANEDDYGISLLHDDRNDQFICKLYKGDDRSYDQTEFETVLFSNDMENLTSSSYLRSTEKYRNVILAMGQGEGSNRARYILGDISGIERREHYKDARDVSTQASLEQRANEALKEYKKEELLDGEVVSDQYQYDIDYFVGDIVQIRNSIGIEGKARIIEVIFSQDTSGTTIYPTVEVMNKEE